VSLKLIRLGAEDEKIKIEYEKTLTLSKRTKALSFLDKVFSLVVCVLIMAVFGVSACVNVESTKIVGDVPVVQVVQSSSMATRYEGNEYLYKNNITDQIQTFDLVTIHKLPDEMDLKLYDIVVYEVDDMLVIHRIVGIEEPNDKHSERYFVLQGDAVHVRDKFPVTYSQMKGIYRGERIPFIGSFVMFMQSPAGYLCILLVLFVLIALPIAEKKILNVKIARLIEIGYLTADGALASQPLTQEETESIKEVLEEKEPIIDDETALTVSPQILYTDVSSDKFVQGLEEETFVKKEWYETAGKGKTFREKHDSASREVLDRYNEIVKHLYKIKGLHVWEGKAFETYKKGRTPIARLAFKGKSLYVHLALDIKEYENSKYVYTDASTIKAYKDYPMRVKVSSDRQVKWVNELVSELAKKSGLYMYAMTTLFSIKGTDKTFEQKLKELSPEMINRYTLITNYLSSIDGVRVKNSSKHVTYKRGSQAVAKLKIIGKTLNVYLNLQPKKYRKTKYKFIDVSGKKSHESYPMRIKITSDRQAKWAIELIKQI
jgi:predicted transport protein